MRAFRFISFILMLALFLPVLAASAQEGGDNPVVTVVPDFLYVRQTPSTNGTVLGNFTRGTRLTVLGVERNANDSGTWVFITPAEGNSKLTGWVRSDFLQYPTDFVGLSNLPVVSTQGSVSGTTSTTTAAGGTTTTTSTTVTIFDISKGVEATTREFANLRSGPELTFGILKQLDPKTDVVIVGRNANSVWLQVVVEDQVGWLFYQLVETDGDINSVPVVGAGETPATVVITNAAGGAPANAPTTIGVKPGTPAGANDGRLNATDDLGNYLIFCVDRNGYTNTGNFGGGGIVVYNWTNASIRFFVPESQILAARANRPENSVIASDGVFVLYVIDNQRLSLTGFDDKNGRNFELQWNNCDPGAAVKK